MTQLFGHQETLQRLLDAYHGQRLHHSLILTGPSGVGRETLAMAFIRAILQDDAKIDAGAHPHLLVIRPVFDEKKQKYKRDITLDALSELTQFLRLAPIDDKPRFIVVKPADGMNNQVQNALLKVLEEPPQNTFFILITTHVAAMLPTIRSRCLVVPIEPLSKNDFARALEYHLPDVDYDMIESYQQLAEGVVGVALQFKQDDLLGFYDELCRVCSEYREEKNSTLAMSFAEKMAAPDMQETTDALIDLVLRRLALFIKQQASSRGFAYSLDSEQQLFTPWQALAAQKLLLDYDRLQRVWQEGIDAYLDRKIVLLSFLRVLSAIDSRNEPMV